jgi:hypothetical protein
VTVPRVAEVSFAARFCGPRAGARWRPVGGAVDARPSVADRDGLVLPEVVWAALDCPSGFAIGAGDTVVVLGRMAARVVARPRAGVAYRLLAWQEGPPQGRRRPAGSALLGAQA